MPMLLFLLLLIAAGVAYLYISKRQARAAMLTSRLTDHQRTIVAEQVPLIGRLPEELHARLEGKITLFLDQVDFYGCNDLDVTEEMELSIAAQACLLVVNRDAWYDTLRTILIYPGAFKSMQKDYNGYVVTERETVRTGESWARGPVILSWPHAHRDAADHRGGQNVVLHEFAHQIDNLSGYTDGAPLLNKGQSYADWARVFVNAYEAHVDQIQNGLSTVIDAYGAEGLEEFFAVVVELFFERPEDLHSSAPEVYAQMAQLFRLDPKTWG